MYWHWYFSKLNLWDPSYFIFLRDWATRNFLNVPPSSAPPCFQTRFLLKSSSLFHLNDKLQWNPGESAPADSIAGDWLPASASDSPSGVSSSQRLQLNVIPGFTQAPLCLWRLLWVAWAHWYCSSEHLNTPVTVILPNTFAAASFCREAKLAETGMLSSDPHSCTS